MAEPEWLGANYPDAEEQALATLRTTENPVQFLKALRELAKSRSEEARLANDKKIERALMDRDDDRDKDGKRIWYTNTKGESPLSIAMDYGLQRVVQFFIKSERFNYGQMERTNAYTFIVNSRADALKQYDILSPDALSVANDTDRLKELEDELETARAEMKAAGASEKTGDYTPPYLQAAAKYDAALKALNEGKKDYINALRAINYRMLQSILPASWAHDIEERTSIKRSNLPERFLRYNPYGSGLNRRLLRTHDAFLTRKQAYRLSASD